MIATERAELLRHVREALVAFFSGAMAPAVPSASVFERHAGIFVTLRHQHDLRGCIGHVESDRPLGLLAGRTAIAAATADPRFPPLTLPELETITIEVSVLGPLEAVDSIDQIEIGRHGLVVEQGRSRGLLLPQVASEWQWDRETFLAHTCLKAGLSSDAWTRGATIYRFEAEVFSEDGA